MSGTNVLGGDRGRPGGTNLVPRGSGRRSCGSFSGNNWVWPAALASIYGRNGAAGGCVAKARRALLRRMASGSRLSKGLPVGGANSVPGRMGCGLTSGSRRTRRISLSRIADRLGPIDKLFVARPMCEANSVSGRRRRAARALFVARGGWLIGGANIVSWRGRRAAENMRVV